MSSNECYNCSEEAEYLWVIFLISSILITGALFAFIWLGVRDEEKSTLAEPPDTTKQPSSSDTCTEEDIAVNGRIMSLKPIRYISRINVTEVKKKIDLQAFTTNSITSFKLILSFYQIMTQVVSSVALFLSTGIYYNILLYIYLNLDRCSF
jgi:hypothetical protein